MKPTGTRLTRNPAVKGRKARVIPSKGAKSSRGRRPAPAAPPFDPTAPLTAEGLNQAVTGAADLAYGGQEQALQGQRNISAQMNRNIPAWFAEYQNALQHATNQTGAAYAAVGAQQQNTASTASALDAQQQQALNANLAADAKTRGATVDPQIAATGQQAGASRRDMLAQFSNLTAAQGGAQVAYNANRQVVGAGQKLSAQTDEATRGRNIEAKAMDVAREKGAYAATTKQKLIDAEHTKSLERKAFGLNVAKAEADVAGDRAAAAARKAEIARKARESRAARGLRGRQLKIAEDKDRYQREHGVGPYAPPRAPAADRAKARERSKLSNSLNTAIGDANTLKTSPIPVLGPDNKPETKKGKDGKPTATGRKRKLTEGEIRAAIRKRYKDADLANAATDVAILGHIGAVNQRRLKARGIRIPAQWLPRPKAKPTPASIITGPSSMSPTNPNR